MQFSNKTYDILKWVAQLLLPGIGTLYMGLSDIWSLPYTDQVVATVVAVAFFLNFMLGLSSSAYFRNLVSNSELESFVNGLDTAQKTLVSKMLGENKKAVNEVPGVNKK